MLGVSNMLSGEDFVVDTIQQTCHQLVIFIPIRLESQLDHHACISPFPNSVSQLGWQAQKGGVGGVVSSPVLVSFDLDATFTVMGLAGLALMLFLQTSSFASRWE